MSITHAPALQEFSKTQINLFLQSKSQGLSDEISVFKAGLKQSALSDLLAAISVIDPHAVQEAQIRAKLPLTEVKKRMNVIMASANDAEEPMAPDLVIDILERQDPQNWSKQNIIQLKAPEPRLDPAEHARLARLFALPEHTPIEGVIIDHQSNEDQARQDEPSHADAEPTVARLAAE